MSVTELAMECLKLAMEQARREATTDLSRVAELQTWFYNRISECGADPALVVKSEKDSGSRRKAQTAEKSPDIYR